VGDTPKTDGDRPELRGRRGVKWLRTRHCTQVRTRAIQQAGHGAQSLEERWWQHAVFYEIYVRSFADSNGDGLGDLEGIRQRLPYLRDLGVDALWLTPFYPSPMADHGYDVADPRDVDPRFGDLAAFDALLTEAHRLGLRLTVDVVPNHTSSEHKWFREALAAAPGSPERERYIFRPGRGPTGELPPNNWRSVFGGQAWAREPRTGEWYLHLFAVEQPDLNWRNPEVLEDAERTLRFWLDRGVDGFRIDVAHGLLKDEQLRDNPGTYDPTSFGHGEDERHSWNQPEVHDVYRRWRALLDSYPGDRMAVGEIWVRDPEDLARYVRPDELHLAFNFQLTLAPWEADRLRAAVDASLSAMAAVGAGATWVLSNHDVPRVVSHYGGGQAGLRRARAAALLSLALPGVAYLYNGEELGLADAPLPDEVLQDPQWLRSGGSHASRDPVRVPLPWSGAAPPFGFTTGRPWLPQPADWAGRTVEAQEADPGSTLQLHKSALLLRRQREALRTGDFRWQEGPPGCLVFARSTAEESIVCAVNVGREQAPLPAGELLLASGPTVEGGLPPDTSAWIALAR
jgi:alpha-glucosidase